MKGPNLFLSKFLNLKWIYLNSFDFKCFNFSIECRKMLNCLRLVGWVVGRKLVLGDAWKYFLFWSSRGARGRVIEHWLALMNRNTGFFPFSLPVVDEGRNKRKNVRFKRWKKNKRNDLATLMVILIVLERGIRHPSACTGPNNKSWPLIENKWNGTTTGCGQFFCVANCC